MPTSLLEACVEILHRAVRSGKITFESLKGRNSRRWACSKHDYRADDSTQIVEVLMLN